MSRDRNPNPDLLLIRSVSHRPAKGEDQKRNLEKRDSAENMAATCSGAGGGKGDDGEDWEERRRRNVKDNERALAEIIKEAKERMKSELDKIKGGKGKGKRMPVNRNPDPTFHSKARPTCTRGKTTRKREQVDYAALSGEVPGEDRSSEEEN